MWMSQTPVKLDVARVVTVSWYVTREALIAACREGNKRNMKQGIHPEYNEIKVLCACGHSFTTRSTRKEDLHVEICSDCHPFFTGKQKLIDTAGRVDRFNKRYGKKQPEETKADAAQTETAAAQ